MLLSFEILQRGIDFIDKRIKEKGIKMRMIVDANTENVDLIKLIKEITNQFKKRIVSPFSR